MPSELLTTLISLTFLIYVVYVATVNYALLRASARKTTYIIKLQIHVCIGLSSVVVVVARSAQLASKFIVKI